MKKLFVALSVCAALALTGCIDRDFDLADTSGEVTIGGEELKLPLGDLERIKLGDIIEENENLNSNKEGIYQVSFSTFGNDPNKYETLTVEGISIPHITGLSPKLNPLEFSFQQMPQHLNLSGINKDFNIDFPTIGEIVKFSPINAAQQLDFQLPSVISGQGTLPEALIPATPFTCSSDHEVKFYVSLSILKELNRINWVEFGSNEHPYGAPFTIEVDLNGLQDINGGGTINLHAEFPANYYLRNEDGSDLPTSSHNIFNKTISFDKKQKTASFIVYLHRIDCTMLSLVDGQLLVNDKITYGYDVNLNLCAGNFNTDAAPKLSISAAPEYKDVEIVINHFDVPTFSEPISYSFNGMPSAIDIEKIAFTEDSEMLLSLKGLEWLSARDNITDEAISPYIEIGMPKCMHFRPHSKLDSNTNTIIASTSELSQGIKLSLDHIDCSSETIKQEAGQLMINDQITATVHLETLDGHTVLSSAITPPDNLSISVSIADMMLTIDAANSKVSWSEDKTFHFDLENQIPALSQTIDIPEIISSVERIEIGKANSNDPFSMTFSFGAMEGSTFPVNELEAEVAVNLGKLLHPTADMVASKLIQQNGNGDYILTIKESWRPNEERLSKTIKFDALENIPEIKNGKIALNQSFPVTGSVKIKSGENIDLSSASGAKIDVDVNIDDIEVRTFTGCVDINVAPQNIVVELSELEGLEVDINALSLNPVLNIKLKDNPTGIPFGANFELKSFDKAGKVLQTITSPTINIAGTGASNIIISTPRNAAKYSDVKDATFVAIDGLSQLLSKGLPAKVTVNMSIASDNSQNYTIDLRQAAAGYTLNYQYEVVLPFEFDGDLDVSCESGVYGLNETFASLADEIKGLTVGDIGLIAEIGTNIPVNVVISAWLVNANGTSEDVEAKLNINNSLIKGHNPANGEKSVSVLDLDFDLGESHSLAGLRNVDGIKFKFSLYDTDNNEIKLSKDMFIEGKLKLRVRDGLTVDVLDLLNNEVEE